MKYLVVCEHRKEVIDQPDAAKARQVFQCSKCADGHRNIRSYRATEKDCEIVVDVQPAPTRKRYKSTDQLDWVGI